MTKLSRFGANNRVGKLMALDKTLVVVPARLSVRLPGTRFYYTIAGKKNVVVTSRYRLSMLNA